MSAYVLLNLLNKLGKRDKMPGCQEFYSWGARDSKIRKKWPESSRILDYILS